MKVAYAAGVNLLASELLYLASEVSSALPRSPRAHEYALHLLVLHKPHDVLRCPLSLRSVRSEHHSLRNSVGRQVPLDKVVDRLGHLKETVRASEVVEGHQCQR